MTEIVCPKCGWSCFELDEKGAKFMGYSRLPIRYFSVSRTKSRNFLTMPFYKTRVICEKCDWKGSTNALVPSYRKKRMKLKSVTIEDVNSFLFENKKGEKK